MGGIDGMGAREYEIGPSLEKTCLMGRTGGTDGNQKCPLKFFKLCGHLELVYI